MKQATSYFGIMGIAMQQQQPEEIPFQPEKPTVPAKEIPTTMPGQTPEIIPFVEPGVPVKKPSEIPNPDHPIKQ